MARVSVLVLAGLTLMAAAALGCGGKSSSSSKGADSGQAKAASTAAPAAQVVNIKDVENGDVYVFDPNQIQVKAGEVTFHYTNPATSQRNHTIEIKTLDGSGDLFKSDQVTPGTTVDFKVTVTSPGAYQ